MDDVTKMVWSDFIDAAQSCTGCTLDSRVHPPSMKFEVWLGLGRRDSEVGTFHAAIHAFIINHSRFVA